MENSHIFGALIIYAGEVNAFDREEVELLVELANDLAYGIHTLRTRAKHISAEVKIHRQLESLAALRAIDLAITSSLDLRVIFDVLLDKVTNQLHVDAACVLLLNQHTQILEFAAGRGFRTDTLQKTSLRLGEGYAGQAALERRVIRVQHLQKRDTDLLRTEPFALEGFVTYFSVPLVAKGHVEGVLEVYHRSHLEPDQEWLDFLEALASQAAIALDNAGLFDNLQRSNAILKLAYDATIEGWSRALDLRDRETEGHSQRVTEMSVKLGKNIGMSEEELVHLRRGALLHDIGKMGIPDSILHKPRSLSEEEWEIVKLHPENAYKLLSPIAYLRPALDIPYCHHEKWDGSGYPRGLKGEQIPLAARIFAVVDVWDALRSNRPYRPAWSEEKALEYIRSNSGSHFDPQVVELFFREVIEEEE
ncbi:MAG: GAF domain-containing protein [Anaerolineales bacterium]|nr:GAF domain-containing protein [Anaerolineales bacterium]